MSVRARGHRGDAAGDMVAVRPVLDTADREIFARFSHELYADEARLRPLPLRHLRRRLDPATNPWFRQGEGQLFVAERSGQIVGTISAHVDFEYLRLHDDGVGFFGFFECRDDPGATRALLDCARDWLWLHDARLTRMRGPMSFSSYGQIGIPVDSFERGNAIFSPPGMPYYPPLLEGAGCESASELHSWLFDRGTMFPDTARQIAEVIDADPEIEVRGLDELHLRREIRLVFDIFRRSEEGRPGFVPPTEPLLDEIVRWIEGAVAPRLSLVVTVRGVPVGACLSLVDYQGPRHVVGRARTTLWSALRRLGIGPAPSGFRVLLTGARSFFSTSYTRRDLFFLLAHRLRVEALSRGFEYAVIGAIADDHRSLHNAIRFLGGRRARTYRVYERPL